MNEDNLELIKDLSPEKRALVLKALKQEAVQSQKPPINRRRTHDEPIPLSLSQHRLWLLDQLRPANYAYNEFAAFRLVGVLEAAALEQSVNEIVRRHEALRTTFATVDGDPVQVIAPTLAIELVVVELSELSGLPEAEQKAELQRVADNEARKPFDLACGPLLRMVLLRFGKQQSVLLITAHHIVVDGWSIGIFNHELADLYRVFCGGQPSPLPELPIQYADFAIWQRRWLQEENLDAQLDYWTRQLSDLPPLLHLPVAGPRPETESFRGGRQYFALDAHLSKELRVLSRRENVTLFMTLLAGFQTLLHRYTNRTDIPVGTPVANRNQAEIEYLIGFFVNTLVLRGDVDGNPSFRELLTRVRGVALAAYENQELPFEQLVVALRPERSLSYNPLFQVEFGLQNTPERTVQLPGLTLTPMEMASVTAKYDLTLSMEETSDGLQGLWEYNSDLFEPATISRMTGHFQTLLQAIVDNPGRAVAEVPLLSAGEQRQLLVEWNRTRIDYPYDKCIHELFEAQVARTPDAIALACADQRLSYRELDRRANQVAHHLQRLGVSAEVPVGVYIQRSLEMVTALLGVLKAGGGYVPLDPSYPEQRLAYMLEDANVTVLLTQEQLASHLPANGARVICLDSDWKDIAQNNNQDSVVSRVTPDNLAYVIYTSGSTGKPKGVLVSHQNLAHSTTARWHYYSQPVTSYLLLSSFAFDSSVVGIYWTLTRGGTLVLPASDSLADMAELCWLIASHGVSHLLSIPSVYALILQEGRSEPLASLKTVIIAGEACPTRVIEQHHRLLENTDIFNEYGPTEATVWSSVYRSDSNRLEGQVPIGRPIANTQLYVLDASLQPVPIGVPGELHIGGAGVARGYLDHPEVTAERFIGDPFSVEPAARLYKTGDLARHGPDGTIEFLGRTDNQVKIRGFRIELGEIEAALLRYPRVRETVTTVREDEEANRRLVSYLTVAGSEPFSISELRDFMLKQLPGAAVPTEFILLDELPRLPNGKVDRRSLPAPEDLYDEKEEALLADWSGLEQSIAGIWQETLSIEAVDLDARFLEIGGDSISIIRVFNRLRDITDKSISITDMFKYQTIRSLAEFLEQ